MIGMDTGSRGRRDPPSASRTSTTGSVLCRSSWGCSASGSPRKHGAAYPGSHQDQALGLFFLRKRNGGTSSAAIGRGTLIGFFLGLIPGIGAIIPTFLAYVVEKESLRTPGEIRDRCHRGVASPETANNSYANAAMVPLLTLGIPGSPTLAVLMGAFIIHGLTPGPFLFKERPDVVWGLIASLYLGNVMLLILNLPLVGFWAKLLEIRYQYLYPGILLFCILGAYSLNQSVFDVSMMVLFGIVGYVFRKLDWPLAPAILALILGPMMERSLRTSLEMSGGDLFIFFQRPISAALLILAIIILVTSAVRLMPMWARKESKN